MMRTPLPKSNALVMENGMLKLAPPGSTTTTTAAKTAANNSLKQQQQQQQRRSQHKSEPQLNVRDDDEGNFEHHHHFNRDDTTDLAPCDEHVIKAAAVQEIMQDGSSGMMPFYQNLFQVHQSAGGYGTVTSTTIHQSHENIYTDLSGGVARGVAGPYALYTPENIYPHLMPQNFMQAQKRRMPRSSSGGSVLV